MPEEHPTEPAAVRADDAMAAFTALLAQGHWTVMLFAPESARLAVRCQGSWVSPDAAQTEFAPAANTFSARAFDGIKEVRWYTGHAPVTVAVHTGSGADGGPGLAGPRLLWGEATDAQHLATCACGTLTAWSHLSDPRIGTIVVPVPLAKAQRAVLHVREVIATDSHGNRYVTDEVVVGLAAMTPEGGNRNA